MDWQGWFCLALALTTLLTLIFTRLSPELVMLAALTILSASGILSSDEALAGFSNSGLVTVAAMFIIAAGIRASGGVEPMIQYVFGRPSTIRRALLRLSLPVVLLSSSLNNTPVVATLIPAVHTWAKRLNVSPSKLMIPLSYSAILGGTLTLIGTSTNLVVNSQFQKLTGSDGLGFFAIAAVGLPTALAGIFFMVVLFPRVLPDRRDGQTAFGNLREYTLEVAVAHDGPLVGKTIAEAGLRHLQRIYLVEIEREGNIVTAVPTEERLRGGDRLVFVGNTDAIVDLYCINGIVASTNDHPPLLTQNKAERRLVEAVVSPQCDCIGQTIRECRFRDRYGAVVLAVARDGQRVEGNLGSIELQAADTLLLEARPAFVSRQRHSRDFLLINDVEEEKPRYHKAAIAWVILAAVIAAAAGGLTSMLNAALLGAGAMLITGCCSLGQARKSLDLTVILTIGASFALGEALEKTGVAAFVGENILAVGGGRPWILLLLTYAVVSLLTEVITNNAAAIIMLPIVLAMTAQAGLSPEPFVIAVMMAASASFATPLGYQTNLMVYGPGSYRFSDFLKVGIPMNLLAGLVSILAIPLIWPLG